MTPECIECMCLLKTCAYLYNVLNESGIIPGGNVLSFGYHLVGELPKPLSHIFHT